MSALFGPILRPGAYRQECVETYDESDPHAVPAVATDPVTWGDLEDPVFRKGRVGKCYNASTVRGIMDKNNRDPMTMEAYDADDRAQVIAATDRDLFAAIRGEYPAIVAHLVATGVSVAERNEHDQTPVFAAAIATESIVRRLMSGDLSMMNRADALHMLRLRTLEILRYQAALDGGHADQTEIMTILIEHGASVNDMCPDTTDEDNGHHPPEHRSPLHVIARSFGNMGAVRCLLEHGADVNAADTSGDTPLHAAAKRNFAPMVEALIAAGADASARNSHGITAFSCALRLDDFKLCESALVLFRVLTEADKFKTLRAVRGVSKFKSIMELGVPMHVAGAVSTLAKAITRGDHDLVAFIIDGEELDDPRDWRWADLRRAFLCDMTDDVAAVILHRFGRFERIPGTTTWCDIFYFALRSGSVRTMEKCMMSVLKKMNVHDSIQKAVSDGRFDNLLLDDSLRDAAWEAAIRGGHEDAVKKMFEFIHLSNGTVYYDGAQWMGFMFAAVRSGDVSMVDLVMERKLPRKQVDFAWRDSLGETILMNAVGDDHLYVLERLVEISAIQRTNKIESTINFHSLDNETALTYFMHQYKVERVRSMHAAHNYRRRMALLRILLAMGPSPEVLKQAKAVARPEVIRDIQS